MMKIAVSRFIGLIIHWFPKRTREAIPGYYRAETCDCGVVPLSKY